MKIFDAHCHIYPAIIAEKAAAATAKFYEGLGITLDGTIKTLFDHSGDITMHLVQSVATTPKQVSSINNFIATSVVESNGKMTGLGTLHPDSEDIEADVNEVIRLGLKGVKLHPDIQNFKVDDYRMLKIYELCEGRLPILMHTGDCRFDNSNPNRLMPVLDIYKNLTLIGAHFGGWSIWEDATKKLHKYENLYVDCSSTLYAVSAEKAKELISVYGADRVLFGTDYPLWDPEDEVARFMKIDLTDKQRDDILYNNAAKLFNI